MYVHHEVQLSSFPLCLEFVGCQFAKDQLSNRCNYMAVGTFNSEIEIWDMDTLNAIEPVLTLGQQQPPNYLNNKKKKKKEKTIDSHSDSVLCLSLNQFRQNILCSGSGDHSIKLWDLQKGSSLFTYQHHTDKVQQVKFNPKEEAVLLSAGFDKQLVLMDVRQQNNRMCHQLQADVETVHWDI